MKYINFYISDNKGNSNCVIRTFCKVFNEDYEKVKEELITLVNHLDCNNYNDIEVFEYYLSQKNYLSDEKYQNQKVCDTDLSNGTYIVFCYDKKDYYHMFPIIDNVYYDKSPNIINLYILKIYKAK